MSSTHPVMTCAEARAFEQKFFAGDTDGSLVRAAMRAAGAGVARETRALLDEAGCGSLQIFVLCGKGRNAGDALIAAAALTDRATRVVVLFAFSRDALCAEAGEALSALEATATGKVTATIWSDDSDIFPAGECLVFDGLTGAGFRPPLALAMSAMIHAANRLPRAIRVAVDLPSGAGDTADETLFRAHLTVATGILKSPLLTGDTRVAAGRIRYADIGFFDYDAPTSPVTTISLRALDALRALRSARCDKRDFGHVAILGGHRTMPGALLMNVLAALRAGAGLVTAFCPESVHAAFAAAAPEAMWVPLPETPDGSLPREALPAVLARIERADALVCGSGLGRSHEPEALVADLVAQTSLPTVLDADALRPPVIEALKARPADAGVVVLTPHAGEFARISGHETDEGFSELHDYAAKTRTVVLHKGPTTRIADDTRGIIVPFGGPALARGGSGDLLAGILGALLAAETRPGIDTVALAAAWHSAAADHVAALHGAGTLRTTDILDGLGPCLRRSPDKRFH